MSIFEKKDYESSNGIQSSVFGPPAWFTLHITSFNYPVNPTADDKKNYKAWLLSHQYTLPCGFCRKNFLNNLTKSGFNDACMKNRETFSKSIYKLHNCVNKMLGKTVKISYEEVRDRYENFRSRCSEKEKDEEQKKKMKELESGCVGSLYGKKSKCIMQIVPKTSKKIGFNVDKKCKATKKQKKITKKQKKITK